MFGKKAKLGAAIAAALVVGTVGCDADTDAAGRAGVFEVRIGERAGDWAERLETRIAAGEFVGLQSGFAPGDLARIAAEPEAFARFAFVAPPQPERPLARFEGLFVPGRYALKPSDTARSILTRLLERAEAERFGAAAREKLANELAARDGAAETHAHIAGMPIDERIILASIAEKEAVAGENYERIAAVFLNRLRENEPLGSCPTVEYALGYHRPFLKLSDIADGNPYNVYRRRGLPPTPIAFFSEAAWRAANGAREDEAYFFVFDWTKNELTFARDYSAHKENAERARSNFIAAFGEKAMRKRYDNRFYEPVLTESPKAATPNASIYE